jgi:Smg-4/UPF3 family
MQCCFAEQIVIRRLPPSWTAEMLLEQIAPVPDHDYFYFVPADMRFIHLLALVDNLSHSIAY